MIVKSDHVFGVTLIAAISVDSSTASICPLAFEGAFVALVEVVAGFLAAAVFEGFVAGAVLQPAQQETSATTRQV